MLNHFLNIAFILNLKEAELRYVLGIIGKEKRSGIHLSIVDQYNIFQLCWVSKINLKYVENDTYFFLIHFKSIPFERSRRVLHATYSGFYLMKKADRVVYFESRMVKFLLFLSSAR